METKGLIHLGSIVVANHLLRKGRPITHKAPHLRVNVEMNTNSEHRRQLQSPRFSFPSSPLIGESTREMLSFGISNGLSDAEKLEHRFAPQSPAGFAQRVSNNSKKSIQHTSKSIPLCDPLTPPKQKDITLPAFSRLRSQDTENVPRPELPHRWNRVLVEVMPCYSLPLAGAKETIHAYKTDKCVHTDCDHCKAFLYCIASATAVLCPECKSIGFVDSSSTHMKEELLGLGMTVEMVLSDPDRPCDTC